MEIFNHIVFSRNKTPLLYDYITNHSISFTDIGTFCVIDISEEHSNWGDIEELVIKEQAPCISETKYSKQELSEAKWLTVRSKWLYDYPQPEDSYKNVTYSQGKYCRECGIGLIQNGCFRFKKTPKWSKRNFCMTNWVFDELFVSERAKAILECQNFKGITFGNVKSKNGSKNLDDIYQVVISNVLKSGILDSSTGIKQECVCNHCGRTKFQPSGRGPIVLKKEAFVDDWDFVKTMEYFGAGASASRRILVSEKVYRFIVENKLDSSLVFEPVLLV